MDFVCVTCGLVKPIKDDCGGGDCGDCLYEYEMNELRRLNKYG